MKDVSKHVKIHMLQGFMTSFKKIAKNVAEKAHTNARTPTHPHM